MDVSMDCTDSTVTTGDATSGQAGAREELAGGAAGGCYTQNGESVKREKTRKELPEGLHLEDISWFRYMGFSHEDCNTLMYFGFEPWVNDCEEMSEFLDQYNSSEMTNAASCQTGEKDGPTGGAVCESDMQDGKSTKKDEKCQREPAQIEHENKSDSVLTEDRAGEHTTGVKRGGHGSDEASLGLDLEDMGWFDYMGYSQEVCETLLYYGCGPWVNDCEEMSVFLDHHNGAVMTNAASGHTGEEGGSAVGAVCENDMQDGKSAKKEEKCQREPAQIERENKSDSVLAEDRAGEDTTAEVDCGGHGSDVCGSDMQDGKSAKQEQKRERKHQIGHSASNASGPRQPMHKPPNAPRNPGHHHPCPNGPVPLMTIQTRPVPLMTIQTRPPTLQRPENRCQLCLGHGHTAVTCRSKDSLCY